MRKQSVQALLWLTLVVQVLAVTRPPAIFYQPPLDVFYKPMETVRLPCEAHGSPSPTYTWKRNGIDFIPNYNDDRVVQLANVGTIVFIEPEDKDEGIYQCFATNAYGRSLSIKTRLRQAKLKPFWLTDTVTIEPVLGTSLTLNCIPPESIPPPYVLWVTEGPDGDFYPVILDARVTMDHEYRLRITNVQQNDDMNGRAYVCTAINNIVRNYTQGYRSFIKPQGSPQSHPVQYMWSSPEDSFGLRGDNLALKCIFSGNPTPDVYWERTDGGSLPDRAKIQSFGQELMIENLQFNDTGTYECWAVNTVTQARVQRTFSVRVESRPYWVAEPQDVEVGVGGTAEFICLANGVPPPEHKWYINGVPLSDVTDERINSRFSQVCEDRIIFSDLTLEDAMVIQCNATNRHGYIFSDVFLNVL